MDEVKQVKDNIKSIFTAPRSFPILVKKPKPPKEPKEPKKVQHRKIKAISKMVENNPIAREKLKQAILATGSIMAASEMVGLTYAKVLLARRRSEEFDNFLNEAMQQAVASIEVSAFNRARDGVEKPVFYQGEQVGTTKEYSDSLTIFMLKSHKPEVYNRPQNVNIESKETIEINGAKDKLLTMLNLGETIDGEFKEE